MLTDIRNYDTSHKESLFCGQNILLSTSLPSLTIGKDHVVVE